MFWLDIYGLSDKKDKQIIEKFLNEFAFRDQIESRAGGTVTILRNEKYQINEEDIPVETTTDAIDIGVRNKYKGFCVYFHQDLSQK